MLKCGVFITRYVARLLSLAHHLINYLLQVTLICRGDTILFRAWCLQFCAFYHRKILLFHHLAFKFLCFLFCQQPPNLCVFLDIAFRDPCLSFCQPPFDYSSTVPTDHHWWAPFQLQNNQSLRHICLKASWVLVYPGVESCSFTGAWAGRCVIAHLDDRWGPS